MMRFHRPFPAAAGTFPRLCAALTLGFSLFAGAPAAAQSKVTLVYSDWHLSEPVWNRSLQEAMADFQRANPDIKVELEPVALGQRDVRYSTALRAKRGPDVFTLDVNPIQQFIQRGWVMDLTPFIQKESGGLEQWKSDFYPRALDVVSSKGKVYGVPKTLVPMMLFYNTKMFADAGLAKPPANWDEFRDAARALTKSRSGSGPVDQWGTTIVLAPAGFDLRFSVFLRGFGADLLKPDYSASALDTPEAKKAFNFIVDLIRKDGVMPPGVAQVDANGARQLLATQRIGMAFESAWAHPIIADINPQLDAWNTLKLAPVPSDQPIRSTLHLKSLFINPNTDHPEQAWKLVKFLTDRAQMQRWFDDNNLLSARKSVNAEYKAIRENDNAALMASELERAAFMPLTPKWPEINEAFRQNLQAAVAGSKSTDQALRDAHAQINQIIAR